LFKNLLNAQTSPHVFLFVEYHISIKMSAITNMINYSPAETSRIIEMAWEDRTPFEAIEHQFGLKENDVRQLMRKNLKSSSFRLWRARVNGRKTKHSSLRKDDVQRFRANHRLR